MSKVLLKNIEYLAEDGTIAQADIAIEDGVIASIGTVDAAWQPDQTIDGTGKLAIPGMVNAHGHAAMTMFRSYADDMLLMDWLQTRIWPAEAKLTAEDVYWGTQLAIAEMIKSGTTTFADMYFFMPEVAKAVAETGMRAVLARGMAGVAPNAQQALTESRSFFKEFHHTADGRITIMLGPHAPYTCPPAYMKQVVALAQELGAEIHTHLSETAGEVADCQAAHGKSPIALMDELGVLDCGVLAAHCVHVSPDDIEIMKAKRVRVVHNPGSNMKLASGIAPLSQMLANGLCVALGTDGAASNNNLDMLEEVRLSVLLHKVHCNDPLVITPQTAVHMATTSGADAVGLGTVTGKLASGYKADITIFDMSSPHWYPRHNKLSLLAYSAMASDVHTVLIDGRIVLDNRRLTTIDEERMLYEANRRALQLVAD